MLLVDSVVLSSYLTVMCWKGMVITAGCCVVDNSRRVYAVGRIRAPCIFG